MDFCSRRPPAARPRRPDAAASARHQSPEPAIASTGDLAPSLLLHRRPSKAAPASPALVFRARHGGPVIAHANVSPSGCSFVVLTVRGRRGPVLAGGRNLGEILAQLGAS